MGRPVHLRPRAGAALAEAERESRVIPLLLQGASLREVARTLGVGRTTVMKDRNRILARWVEETKIDRDQFAALVSARYEAVLDAFWPQAMEGDEAAAATVVRVLKSLREMYGLDEPTRVDARVSDMAGAEGAGTLIDRMRARALASGNIIEGNGHHSEP